MKKTFMNLLAGLFFMAGLVGCGESSKQKEEATPEETTEVKQAEAEPRDEQAPVLPNGEQIFTVVEVMPEYPGGVQELLGFLKNSIQYPKESIDKEEEGRVICAFVVNKDGSLSNFEVLRSVSPALDKEAIRVLQTMPSWTPGKQKGNPVAVRYTVPVTFRLKDAQQ